MYRLAWSGLLWAALCGSAAAENWPAWRGPDGTGVSNERNLPLAWTGQNKIRWRTALPGWGTSTPAIWDDALFVTTQDGEKLLLARLDKRTGKTAWTAEVGRGETPRTASGRGEQKFHDLHNLASPSPTTDGKHVVVHFGNGDLACYDFDGQQLWKRNLQDDHGKYTIWWGHANSPVIHNNLVISVCMQDALDDLQPQPAASYLVAHELATGKLAWYTPRMPEAKAEQCDSYTTPIFYRGERGVELLVMGGNELDAYDPERGNRLWKIETLVGGRTVTGPALAGDVVFVTRGMRGPMLSIDLAGNKPPSRRSIVWTHPSGTPDSCSPVVTGGLLFAVNDDGVARCFEAHNGALKWTSRLRGSYKASPLAADGRVYFVNTSGLCTVISATPRFERLTENQIDDEFVASPAVSDGWLYLRGRKELYAIGD